MNDSHKSRSKVNHEIETIKIPRSQKQDFTRDNECCYQSGRSGHFTQNFPELKRISFRKNKNFGDWSDEVETEEETEAVTCAS